MKKYQKTLIIGLVLFGVMAMFGTVMIALSVRVASVQSVSGSVSVLRAGTSEWIPATVDMKLYQGDEIKTGGKSKAVIELDDGTVMQVTSLAHMTMDQLSKSLRGKNTNIDLEVGKSWMKVKKLNVKADNFNVSTPTAVAGVRGTYFSTEVEQTTDSTFDVFEGEVAVAQRNNPMQQVSVRENQRSEVKSGKGPSTPSKIPADELQQGLSEGIAGAVKSENSSYDMKIQIDPQMIPAGGKAKASIQFTENGKPYNGKVTFVITLGGSAVFVENGSQTAEITSNEKGFASFEITDPVKEEVTITSNVLFEEQK